VNSGAAFDNPVVVSTGRAFGYTSVILDDDGSAVVSWLEQGAEGARILLRGVARSGNLGAVREVARGTRQSLGYPRMLHAGKETWIAWGNSRVQTARLMK
jgi:hypothetical protein